jgi:hypothetical protein
MPRGVLESYIAYPERSMSVIYVQKPAGEGTNDRCIDEDGDPQADQAIEQELPGSLAFQRPGREIPGQQEKCRHKVRLVERIKEHQENRTDVIHRGVLYVPVSGSTVSKGGMVQDHQDRQIDPEIVQVKQPGPRFRPGWLGHSSRKGCIGAHFSFQSTGTSCWVTAGGITWVMMARSSAGRLYSTKGIPR